MEEKKVYRPGEVAKLLGVSSKTVYKMLQKNQLPFIKCGDLYIIPASAFERYLFTCSNGSCQSK